MRLFSFRFDLAKDKVSMVDNGWEYELNFLSKVGYIVLKSPIIKEVTHNKGPTIRYVKHNIFCVGYIKNKTFFQGIAFFDFPIRFLIVLAIAIFAGGIWSCLFYLVMLFISYDYDDYLLQKVRHICEK